MAKKPIDEEPEFEAMSRVYAALKELEPEAQARVLNYVADKLKIAAPTREVERIQSTKPPEEFRLHNASESGMEPNGDAEGELEGISPVARKWMTRTGLEPAQLSKIFSLSSDEIDLITNSVPGENKKERMRSVFLLKGVAAYLGSGAARFSHQQIKEACLHYDAFDVNHFSAYFKSLSSEVSGSKDTGYTLSARGIANATEMLKKMA